MNQFLMAPFVIFAAAVLGGVAVHKAEAAFPCNWGAGEYQVGEDNGVPLCEISALPEQSGTSHEETAKDSYVYDANAPLQRNIKFEIDQSVLIATIAREEKGRLEAEFGNNPVYQRMKAGYWEYKNTPPGMAKGDGCAATYVNLSGAVTIAGPKADLRQATITFWTGHIPVPAQDAMEDVTLAQTGGNPPATVNAYHFGAAGGQLGAVTFVVPDAQALVNGMFDQHAFTISKQGSQWMEIGWRNGNEAKKQLMACLAG